MDAGLARSSASRGLSGHIASLLERRTEANARFFAAEAERLADVCRLMAERFARGGRLLACGASPQGRSDVRHVAVEFVHPVIVGKRALPALGLGPEGGDLARQIELAARPEDIVIAFGLDSGIALARERGCLTLAFAPGPAEWSFLPEAADALVRQELVETLYHVLWELVHVFFEQRRVGPLHDAGPASFLYPFLGESEPDLDGLLDDVRRSVLMKAEEVAALRAQTLLEGERTLLAAAAVLRRSFDARGAVLACGNGGSATDAMDLAADFRWPPEDSGWPARPALDLTEDAAILTALGNDIGHEALFARQVIAYGRPGDVLVAFSTSGTSGNVIAALGEARRRGLASVAFVGYGGGRIAAEALADHVIVTRSEHVPRIQEAQASAYHVLRELVELS